MPRWTEREDELLREHYQTEGSRWEGWSGVLPDRTPHSIACRAQRLGLRANDARRRAIQSMRESASLKEERAVIAVNALDYHDRLRLCKLFCEALDSGGFIFSK